MIFLYPLGLIGLVGIPIIIAIYILKNKYTEQTIASTYIWELSERFLKNKKPISKLKGLISLILQCLIVLFVTLLVAHPVLVIKNSAKEYCFILDGSASMNEVEANGVRFDLAKNEISSIIDNSYDGSKYSLVYTGTNTRIVYEKISNKERAKELLNALEVSEVSTSITGAMSYCQEYFSANPSVATYLVTDKAYNATNIEVINVGTDVLNAAILNANYFFTSARYDSDGYVITPSYLYVTGTLKSNLATNVTLDLYVDNTLVESKNLALQEEVEFEAEYQYQAETFNSIKLVIRENDALSYDNTYVINNLSKEHDYKALIVSSNPFYLESIIKAYGVTTVETKKPSEYRNSMRGYGLYIFDSCTPEEIPDDGTIWLFNTTGSIANTGFSYRESIELKDGAQIELAKGSSSLYKELTKDMLNLDMYVRTYNRYGQYKTFTSILTVNGDPVVFTGENNYQNREVVFAFDLHETNLPLSFNFMVLFKNLLTYSFPTIIDEANYQAGDELNINVISDVKSIRVETPSNSSLYLDTTSKNVSYTLSEIGEYKITININDELKVFKLYSKYPDSEYQTNVDTISLLGVKENNNSDGTYDNILWLCILLGLVFVADWMVYCYEQYQLR